MVKAFMAQRFHFRTRVQKGGKVILSEIPLQEGTPLSVILIEENGVTDELLAASQSSIEFWDNPIDDQTWNAA